MDTKPLERFATWARRELITVVDAQASAVLANGSVARTERPDAVRRLESEIERDGRQQVVDKVAYTWFNRIIALRFMDARGFTDAGVVSPAQRQEHGQPEILADAKRGNLDSDVVTSSRTADAILGLLDGTRHSTDAEGEAYALLLTEYCRLWHKSMPFMFEREGDYTELLVPANLLADGAILSRARRALTEAVCEDVEVIGWLYQFYISERKDEVFAGFKNNKKAGADEIPAATQLFTPHWIVRYLVENSLGRLWMLNHPESRLVEQMDYYIAPVDDETEFLKIRRPEDLTIIDPACGSGHMLTYAFDVLYAIYEEDGYAPSEIPGLILSNNLHGTEIDPRAGALAAFALSMKARAKQRTFFSKKIEPKICVIEPISFRPDEIDVLTAEQVEDLTEQAFWNQFEHADTLGSLIQPDAARIMFVKAALERTNAADDIIYSGTVDRARKLVLQAELLSNRYAVVVANPPYMGSKNMNARLSEFAKQRFPDTKSDLFAMFIERCLWLVEVGGFAGLMSPFVWMFLSSYEKLRERLLTQDSIISLIQLEYSGFDGATVPICTYVLRRGTGQANSKGAFVRLSDFVGAAVQGPRALAIIEAERAQRAGYASDGLERHLHRVSSTDFEKIPGSPIAYWLSEKMRGAFSMGHPLNEAANLRQGLATADNNQFLRKWWEVSGYRTAFSCTSREEAAESGARWFPYNKGGDFRKWYGNHEFVVNWEDDGAQIRAFGTENGGRPRSRAQNTATYFSPSVSWSDISSSEAAFRKFPTGFIHDVKGMSAFGVEGLLDQIAVLMNSSVAREMLKAVAPTLNFQIGDVGKLPVTFGHDEHLSNISDLVAASKNDWDSFETSWNFERPSWLQDAGRAQLHALFSRWSEQQSAAAHSQKGRETGNNRIVAEVYGLEDEVPIEVPLSRVSLTRNVAFRYGPGKSAAEYEAMERTDLAAELISYAVGCMFGRYSLDLPGLILVDQSDTLREYLAKVPQQTFMPDADNVIPFVDDGWFEDDIVERFRQFLRVAFGAEHFEENLRFVEESLGVKSIRDYFVTKNGKSKFYEDHVQRYKKRPIYWMFSSPKGSFNALIYMHRYTPSTVSTVLNEYLREYRAKLDVARADAENAAAGGSVKDQKEADRLRKVLLELAEYEHDVLYPLATRQLPMDLDDGVLVNYLRFGRALKDIGVENDRRKVEGWTWPRYPLEAPK